MAHILIVYYSRTGDTEKLAKAVADGAKNGGKAQIELTYFVEPEELEKFDAIIVGVPTYNHDIPIEIQKLFMEAALKGINLKGKVCAAFGSYGWSGEAPKLVLEIMKNKFEMRGSEPPLLVKYTPDQNALDLAGAFGKRVSESLIQST
jgi:flavorubredoxin